MAAHQVSVEHKQPCNASNGTKTLHADGRYDVTVTADLDVVQISQVKALSLAVDWASCMICFVDYGYFKPNCKAW